jgi:hypothetical protein
VLVGRAQHADATQQAAVVHAGRDLELVLTVRERDQRGEAAAGLDQDLFGEDARGRAPLG